MDVSQDERNRFFYAAIAVGTGFAAKPVNAELAPARGEICRGDLANSSAHANIISALITERPGAVPGSVVI